MHWQNLNSTDSIFLIHFSATWFMVGLIWFIQLVHYPLLGDVSKYRTAAYHHTHMRLATWVVAPAMLVEFLSGVFLVCCPPDYFALPLGITGLALLIIIWLSSAFLQAPRHKWLAEKYDQSTHQSLVASNWVRTISWSCRGLLVFLTLFLR